MGADLIGFLGKGPETLATDPLREMPMTPTQQYLLVYGNPVDGCTFHGPFATAEEANEYADKGDRNADWWVAPLHPAEATGAPTSAPTTPIALSHWVPDPDRPGYLKFAGTPTYREVFDTLAAALNAEGLIDEYFNLTLHLEEDTSLPQGRQRADDPLPRDIHWVPCWAVTGGSEGHYIHIEFEVVDREHRQTRRVPFALGKTFLGRDHAWKIAKRVAELLDA